MSESVSIILPVYNAEKHLAQCIESVLNLKDSIEWELVIIDDGSTDSSLSICNRLAGADSRVQVLHVENGGVSRARNLGLQNARNRIITFIDADDWIDAEAFVKAFQSFVALDAEMGFVPFFSSGENGIKEIPLALGEDRVLSPSEKDYLLKRRLGAGVDFHGYVWRCFFSRELLADAKFDDSLKYNEDVLFCIGSLYKATKVAVVNCAYYYYRVNLTQQPLDKGAYSLENRIVGWNKIKEWADLNGVDFAFALMRRHCPIYARMFAHAAAGTRRGLSRIRELWKIHREIPSEERKQWKSCFWGKSFAPYSVFCRYGFDFLGFLFLCLRFF